jgi:hypothetical protein
VVSGLVYWILTTDRRCTRMEEQLRELRQDMRTVKKRQDDFLK